MEDMRIVFILGAGVSKPYGYPLSDELNKAIIDRCDFYIELIYKLRETSPPGSRFASKVRDVLPNDIYIKWVRKNIRFENSFIEKFLSDFKSFSWPSIDFFINRKQEYSELAKAIISDIFLDIETSLINFRNFNISVEDQVLEYLFLKTYPPNSDDSSLNKCSFVTFNYDRLLEYRLANYFEIVHNLIGHEVTEKLLKIPIYHVYGSMPQIKEFDNNCQLKIKDSSRYELTTTNDLQLMFSDRSKVSNINIIQDLIVNANYIFFLGFGFDIYNMKVLLSKAGIPIECNNPNVKIGFSCYNKLQGEIDAIKLRLKGIIPSVDAEIKNIENCDEKDKVFLRKSQFFLPSLFY